MKIQTTRPFDKDYQDLPLSIKEQADKQLTLFLNNPRHPSLNVKKVKGHPRIWEGRITKNYRFTFQFEGDFYILRRIGPHDILDVAKAEEASDPRRPGRSCIGIPRALENEGDEASYGFPGG